MSRAGEGEKIFFLAGMLEGKNTQRVLSPERPKMAAFFFLLCEVRLACSQIKISVFQKSIRVEVRKSGELILSPRKKSSLNW